MIQMNNDGGGEAMMMGTSSSCMLIFAACCIVASIVLVRRHRRALGIASPTGTGRETRGEVMGMKPTVKGQCPKGQHIRNIAVWTGEWGDVTGMYAECVDPKTGVIGTAFQGDGVEEDTGAAGKTGKGKSALQKLASNMTMGIRDVNGKGFEAGAITDADRGFTRMNVAYDKDSGFIYDLAAATADGRRFAKVPFGGFKVWGGDMVDAAMASAVMWAVPVIGQTVGQIGAAITMITSAASRAKLQNKIKKQWSDYDTFAGKFAPADAFPLKFGPTGDVTAGKPPDITKWKTGCYGRICHQKTNCPPGQVITGIDVSVDKNRVTRGFQVTCNSPQWAS
jgi:hypothetical protein